jgi:hypothetical protein
MINIEQVSDDHAQEYLRRLKEGDDLSHFGISIKGFFDVVCREEGETVWEVHQPNLLTDYGRRYWAYGNFTGYDYAIFTSPIAETPRADRYTLADHSGQCQQAAFWYGTNDAPSVSKAWSNTFGLPASNKTIASVGLRSNATADAGAYGISSILCYSLLTPMKVQTTSQTLEISYRLTLSPGV